jgi:acyl-CoA synthetase (NDP forming)
MNAQSLIAEARRRGRTALDELAGKQLLAGFGIAVPKSILVQDAREAATACTSLRSPLVLKVMSPDILHKSDVGGVRMGLDGAEAVTQAIRGMMATDEIARSRIDGFLIEETSLPGQEIVVGAVRDPQFGPLIMTGLGGVLVEVLADVAFRICPLTRLDADEMLTELKGAPLLDGVRGRKPVSRAAIVDVLLKIGGEGGLLMTHAEDIQEADINPLIVTESGAVAVDARFILTKK